MVIASSGAGSSISFTRIISSISSYSVVNPDSKTFRDSTSAGSKRLRGLFVVDKNNLVALIYDVSSFSYKTDVANLNLVTLSVSYQPSLPRIDIMQTGVFVNASVYYTASYHSTFYKDHTTNLNLNSNKYQGIVYSSDMSMS